MNKEMENVLMELLNVFALEPTKKLIVLDRIGAEQNISFEICIARLVEQLQSYAVSRSIDPEQELSFEANHQFGELLALIALMLQSQIQDIWSRDAVTQIGSWTLLTRLAVELCHSLGKSPDDRINFELLGFHVMG